MSETAIEWATDVWNPVRGCTRISPGCGQGGQGGCYAERQAIRQAKPGQAYHGLVKSTSDGPRWTNTVRLADEATLSAPLHWRKPRRIFVNSMSDLFHKDVELEWIGNIIGVMARASWHQFLVLTKRADLMRAYFAERPEGITSKIGSDVRQIKWPLPNVWLGVSVENQQYADERIPELIRTPAAVRFVSYEPALGPVDFKPAEIGQWPDMSRWMPNAKEWDDWKFWMHKDNGIGWIIVGGESGPGARPFDVAWARSTVAQCKAAGVPVFVKQLGAKPIGQRDGINACPRCHGRTDLMGGHLTDEECRNRSQRPISLRDRKGGDMSEWPEDLRVREFPKVPA